MAEPRCPLCRKPEHPDHKPFCSRSCKDRDLVNWLEGAYVLPRPLDENEDASGLDSTPDA